MVGGLPEDASRDVADDEMRAFDRWGWHIQRADALADFVKDVNEGLANSWAGRTCYARFGDAYRDALTLRRTDVLEAILGRCQASCLPAPLELRTSVRAVEGLGDVGVDLSWIHAMLVGRWHARRGEVA